VKLSRQCVEDDPQSWQFREVHGAALYRLGRPSDAVTELDKAVQLHREDGSLWARLFLALAHRRLGNSDMSREWRDKGGQAETWEEQVLQARLLFELDTMQRPGP